MGAILATFDTAGISTATELTEHFKAELAASIKSPIDWKLNNEDGPYHLNIIYQYRLLLPHVENREIRHKMLHYAAYYIITFLQDKENRKEFSEKVFLLDLLTNHMLPRVVECLVEGRSNNVQNLSTSAISNIIRSLNVLLASSDECRRVFCRSEEGTGSTASTSGSSSDIFHTNIGIKNILSAIQNCAPPTIPLSVTLELFGTIRVLCYNYLRIKELFLQQEAPKVLFEAADRYVPFLSDTAEPSSSSGSLNTFFLPKFAQVTSVPPKMKEAEAYTVIESLGVLVNSGPIGIRACSTPEFVSRFLAFAKKVVFGNYPLSDYYAATSSAAVLGEQEPKIPPLQNAIESFGKIVCALAGDKGKEIFLQPEIKDDCFESLVNALRLSRTAAAVRSISHSITLIANVEAGKRLFSEGRTRDAACVACNRMIAVVKELIDKKKKHGEGKNETANGNEDDEESSSSDEKQDDNEDEQQNTAAAALDETTDYSTATAKQQQEENTSTTPSSPVKNANQNNNTFSSSSSSTTKIDPVAVARRVSRTKKEAAIEEEYVSNAKGALYHIVHCFSSLSSPVDRSDLFCTETTKSTLHSLIDLFLRHNDFLENKIISKKTDASDTHRRTIFQLIRTLQNVSRTDLGRAFFATNEVVAFVVFVLHHEACSLPPNTSEILCVSPDSSSSSSPNHPQQQEGTSKKLLSEKLPYSPNSREILQMAATCANNLIKRSPATLIKMVSVFLEDDEKSEKAEDNENNATTTADTSMDSEKQREKLYLKYPLGRTQNIVNGLIKALWNPDLTVRAICVIVFCLVRIVEVPEGLALFSARFFQLQEEDEEGKEEGKEPKKDDDDELHNMRVTTMIKTLLYSFAKDVSLDSVPYFCRVLVILVDNIPSIKMRLGGVGGRFDDSTSAPKFFGTILRNASQPTVTNPSHFRDILTLITRCLAPINCSKGQQHRPEHTQFNDLYINSIARKNFATSPEFVQGLKSLESNPIFTKENGAYQVVWAMLQRGVSFRFFSSASSSSNNDGETDDGRSTTCIRCGTHLRFLGNTPSSPFATKLVPDNNYNTNEKEEIDAEAVQLLAASTRFRCQECWPLYPEQVAFLKAKTPTDFVTAYAGILAGDRSVLANFETVQIVVSKATDILTSTSKYEEIETQEEKDAFADFMTRFAMFFTWCRGAGFDFLLDEREHIPVIDMLLLVALPRAPTRTVLSEIAKAVYFYASPSQSSPSSRIWSNFATPAIFSAICDTFAPDDHHDSDMDLKNDLDTVTNLCNILIRLTYIVEEAPAIFLNTPGALDNLIHLVNRTDNFSLLFATMKVFKNAFSSEESKDRYCCKQIRETILHSFKLSFAQVNSPAASTREHAFIMINTCVGSIAQIACISDTNLKKKQELGEAYETFMNEELAQCMLEVLKATLNKVHEMKVKTPTLLNNATLDGFHSVLYNCAIAINNWTWDSPRCQKLFSTKEFASALLHTLRSENVSVNVIGAVCGAIENICLCEEGRMIFAEPGAKFESPINTTTTNETFSSSEEAPPKAPISMWLESSSATKADVAKTTTLTQAFAKAMEFAETSARRTIQLRKFAPPTATLDKKTKQKKSSSTDEIEDSDDPNKIDFRCFISLEKAYHFVLRKSKEEDIPPRHKLTKSSASLPRLAKTKLPLPHQDPNNTIDNVDDHDDDQQEKQSSTTTTASPTALASALTALKSGWNFARNSSTVTATNTQNNNNDDDDIYNNSGTNIQSVAANPLPPPYRIIQDGSEAFVFSSASFPSKIELGRVHDLLQKILSKLTESSCPDKSRVLYQTVGFAEGLETVYVNYLSDEKFTVDVDADLMEKCRGLYESVMKIIRNTGNDNKKNGDDDEQA